MNDEELIRFVVDNRHALADLVAFVDRHEEIRNYVGPGNIATAPGLVPEYAACHEGMSKLSLALIQKMPTLSLGAIHRLHAYRDWAQRARSEGVNFETIAVSC